MSVLVFIEVKSKVSKPALEAISYGSKIGSTTVITYGNIGDQELNVIGEYGGEKTLINRNLNDSNDQKLTNLICAAVDHTGADVVIISQDQTGKSIGPRVAAKLNAGHVSGAISLPETTDGFIVNTNVFSGKAMARIAVHSSKKVISLLPNSHVPEKTNGSTVIEEFKAELGEGKIVIKELKTQGEGVPLPEAELVVSAGRGLKGPENWGIVEDLAKTIGATTACSRPVADIGWRPHHEHVGQTGIAIRPNLYIAAGISGAIQHLAGVNGSKVIVVINTDSEAPFFKAADYGIIGDAFEVLPRLNEAFKKFQKSQN